MKSDLSPPRHAFAQPGSQRFLGLALLLSTTAAAQERAADVPVPPVAPSPTVSGSLSWCDYNSDGFVDAWSVQPNGSGVLLENDGLGGFIERTRSAGLATATGAHMAVWADVDGDTRPDLYLPAWTGESRLFLQTEPGSFVDSTTGAGLPADAKPLDAAWMDYDNDGAPDLYLVTLLEEFLYRNTGQGQFEHVDLGATPRQRELLGANWSDATLSEARAALGLSRDAAPSRPGAAAAASSGSTSIGTQGAAGPASGICAGTIEDMATGMCLGASSVPSLGLLYPISTELYVDASTGFVGMGTTSPSSPLTVVGDVAGRTFVSSVGTGTAPLSVASSTKVNLLNADLLDGVSSEELRLTADPITAADILNETIDFSDIAENAVRASELADGSVDNGALQNNSITSVKVQNNSLTQADIAEDSIYASELAPDAVASENIIDGSIAGADIGQNGANAGDVLKWNGAAWAAAFDVVGVSPWNASGGNISYSGGRVGIGTSSPNTALEVNGSLGLSSTSDLRFRAGVNASDHGIGWYGAGRLFEGFNVDGTVVYGFNGGALGSHTAGTEKIALRWNNVGRVAIGRPIPLTTLHVEGDGLMVTGDSGPIPLGGAGTRFMWYSGKKAFRAGQVNGGRWDDVNIGNYSAALGLNTRATGDGSFAVGLGAEAEADSSVAMGQTTKAEGTASFAVGLQNTAIGDSAVAMGFGTQVDGIASFGVGFENTVAGNVGVAMGLRTVAQGNASAAMGFGTRSQSRGSVALGAFNVGLGNPTELLASNAVLEIGNGGSDMNRSNALTVFRNGLVGIGTTTPARRLDVNGIIRCISLEETSDARLKADIQDVEGALETVKSLRPVSYAWDRKQLPSADTKRHLGFLAQEVRELVPDAVGEAADGRLSLSYTQIIPLLTGAIQSQQSQLDALREANRRLETQLAGFERIAARLSELEAAMTAPGAQDSAKAR